MEFNPYIGVDADTFFNKHKNLVHTISRKWFNRNKHKPLLEYDDIFSVACIGFLDAYKRFNSEKASSKLADEEEIRRSFVTYAGATIQGEIQKYIRTKLPTVRAPRSVLDVAARIFREGLEKESLDVIYEKLKEEELYTLPITKKLIKEGLHYIFTQNITSIHEVLSMDGEGNEITHEHTLALSTTDPENLFIEEFITTLPKREQELFQLRLQGTGQHDISEITGLSQSYISRIFRNRIKPNFVRFLNGEPPLQNPRVYEKKEPVIKAPEKPIEREEETMRHTVNNAHEIEHLLANTRMPYQEIADQFGVSISTVTKMARIHRPKEVREAIRVEARQKGAEVRRAKYEKRQKEKGQEERVGTEVLVSERKEPSKVIEVGSAAQPTNGQIIRHSSFSYHSQGQSITPEEVVKELEHLLSQVKRLDENVVHFTFGVETVRK